MRFLLSTVLLTLSLLACDAATVGVRLPQGGPDAVQPDELHRLLWTLTDPRLGGRVPGSSGASRVAAEVAKRFQKLHLEPAFGESFRHDLGPARGELVCGIRPGGGQGAVTVAALDPGIGILSAVPIAGLIGLVKAFDGPEERDRAYAFCLLPEAGGLEGYLTWPPTPVDQTARFYILGSLTGPELQASPGPDLAGIHTKILHTGPLASSMGDDMGKVDFEALAVQVKTAYSTVSEGR